jgi:hypothetical protein
MAAQVWTHAESDRNVRSPPILLKKAALAAVGLCRFTHVLERSAESMMGERQVEQGSLFYQFSLERHVPADHLLRAIEAARPIALRTLAELRFREPSSV